MRKFITLLVFLSCSLFSTFYLQTTAATQAANKQLTIGITLHPYYSYVKAVVGDKATVVPLIDSGFNPHNYHLNPTDIARLRQLDALVINGIGHDDFALEAVQRIKLPKLTLIEANKSVALLANSKSKANSHTFVGIDTAIRQVYTIAQELAKLDPENGKLFQKNAVRYARELRKAKKPVQQQLMALDLSKVKIASTHNAYGYFLQEFGLTVAAVVEPAHGISPTASQLQGTIDEIRALNIDVLFTELNMKNSAVHTIERETGVKLFHFSHMTHGEYTQDLVLNEMKYNLDMLAQAISFATNKPQGAHSEG
ncbi:zinc ABC transporter substrate-binding protein [Colwellia sp. D2M02]|uniref:metal ABC transporter solute-binding protein, Zn/Mn family n=1 Tax=Colwellia sp. D2M02 TaxID=2841562 RepID=UPI001C080584|nr:zinc ABC transporter substrate-binding protein [Colwellia sp. D2M02]MBU2891833.1 zinc ABC transporter substrate-binding protein [Colwellia sp. D2M02]